MNSVYIKKMMERVSIKCKDIETKVSGLKSQLITSVLSLNIFHWADQREKLNIKI